MASSSPTDIYIALMGVTGVGKSAFISHCTAQTPVVGDGLRSCTRRVQTYSFPYNPSVTVHLVDTPGFDDTNRKDSDVLREISAWLSESYTHQVLLSGILYLHRITDIRMQGSGKMSLALLHKLCGSEALKKVVLVTTMWDRETPAVGEQREQELATTQDFWGFYMQHGSQIRRHYNNTQSAMNIISLFVPHVPSAAPETITLAIQRELTDERKTLDQTGAGQILDSAWAREKADLQQELREAREAMRSVSESRDATMARLLQEQRQEMDRTVSLLQQEQAKLRVTMEQLHAERLANMEEMLLQQRNVTQSLTQDLERMRLADSDRRENERLRSEQSPAEQQGGAAERPRADFGSVGAAGWVPRRSPPVASDSVPDASILRRNYEKFVGLPMPDNPQNQFYRPVGEPEERETQQQRGARQQNQETEAGVQPGDKAAQEELSARLLQASAMQTEQVGDGLDQLRAVIASGDSLPRISGVGATGIGLLPMSGIFGDYSLMRYSVTKSGLSRWCDACRVTIGADVRYLCPFCRVAYCKECWRIGRGCQNRDHSLVLDTSGVVATSCRRLMAPPSSLFCNSNFGCERNIFQGVYFHCCCDGAELDFCLDCVTTRGRGCPKTEHELQWGVVPISSLPSAGEANARGVVMSQRVVMYLYQAWLQETDAPPRVFRAVARAQAIRLGRNAVGADITAGTVKAQITMESFPGFCDYCMGVLETYYKCSSRHPELGGIRLAICGSCHAQGVRCPSGHSLPPGTKTLPANCRRARRPTAVEILCDGCRRDIRGLYLHCCECSDNVDLCLPCVRSGTTCPVPLRHKLTFQYYAV